MHFRIMLVIVVLPSYRSIIILNIEYKKEDIMAELQETKTVMDGLEGQLSKLVHELGRIADALEKPAQQFPGMTVEASNDL